MDCSSRVFISLKLECWPPAPLPASPSWKVYEPEAGGLPGRRVEPTPRGEYASERILECRGSRPPRLIPRDPPAIAPPASRCEALRAGRHERAGAGRSSRPACLALRSIASRKARAGRWRAGARQKHQASKKTIISINCRNSDASN
jgi:hypothetical protein